MKSSKRIRGLRRGIVSLGLAAFLTGGLGLLRAADDVLWTWDTAGALGSWGKAWGQAEVVQDALEDNTGNGGGAMYISTDYAGSPPDDNRNVVVVMGNHGGWLWNSEVQVDLVEYASLSFDIKWDPTSTVTLESFNTAGGDNGLVVWSARHNGADWEWVQFGSFLVPAEAATGWANVTIPIDPTTANLDRSTGVVFKKWVPQDVANAGGVAAFWIDNVKLTANAGPVAPPTMAVGGGAKAGLNLVTLAGGQWQRQGIRTVGENFSWVGSGGSTTYEFTVAEMPAPAYGGFNTYMYLVPRDPRNRVDPDWAHADVVRFDMSQQEDGSFLGAVRYKINAADSNGTMYGGDGDLGTVSSSTPLGRWGFTFNDDSSITLFSPEATAEALLPAAAVGNFDDALTVYMGSMPNAPERIGQKSVISQIKIEGGKGGVNIVENFTGDLDPARWELAAEYPAGVLVLGEDALFWMGWGLPDTGFGLMTSSSLAGGDWVAFAGSNPILPTGSTKSVLIGRSDVEGQSQGFFQLKKRQFTKLQILLPGETSAPGTATGKTGTPLPQTQYGPFQVTVNAVADDWGLITGVTDVVSLTTTDLDPLLPPDTALVNGTVTLTFDPGTVGKHTITVSDVTNPLIQSDTSSEFTVAAP